MPVGTVALPTRVRMCCLGTSECGSPPDDRENRAQGLVLDLKGGSSSGGCCLGYWRSLWPLALQATCTADEGTTLDAPDQLLPQASTNHQLQLVRVLATLNPTLALLH